MLYPQNIEAKLGFDKIRFFLKEACLSSLGQAYVDRVKFSTDFELVGKMIRQTNEFRQLLIQQLNFPSNNYIDVTPFFSKIKPEGSFLEEDEFRQLKLSVLTILDCLTFLRKYEEDFPSLFLLQSEVQLTRDVYDRIHKLLEDDGKIRDNASPVLSGIRKALNEEQQQLRRAADKIARQVKAEGYSEEDSVPTIRNGRIVLAIKAEYKRKVKGFIHDESATGQTTFIEPAEIFDRNNAIKEYELQEKREIIKLLTGLTDFLRTHSADLRKAYVFLGIVDFVRAKAKLSIDMEANFCTMENSPSLDWINAFHPLLVMNFKKSTKAVTPLTIALNSNQRIVLISGPNAGGKSVCLKTVGLIQYMLQCGLMVPVNEQSTLGFFNDLFLDIGDEQSLENDLSTYSAHLTNMNVFVGKATAKSLVLIDEFGTGTEPQFGAAIAEAVLEELYSKNILGVITTHYSNLKIYADQTDGIVNAAMAYDIDQLAPLYRLEIGKPGSSYAFEIAKKIGLSAELIERSKQKVGVAQVDFDSLIRELEADKQRLSALLSKNKEIEKKLQETLSNYTEQVNALEFSKKQLLKEAKEKAKDLVVEANKKIEATIRTIKEYKADKEVTKIARQELEVFKEVLEQLVPDVESLEGSPPEVLDPIVRIGDFVRVKDSGALGEVIALNAKEAELSIGALRSSLKLSRLIKISKKEFRKSIGEDYLNSASVKPFNYLSRVESFSPILDVRGMRAEEALIELTKFIDNATILSAGELKIIHGKGDGILRTMLRKHLEHYKQVKSVRDEHADMGGAGVSLVRLK